MKNSEDIETMFSRFQTFVSSLQVLSKSNTIGDHVKKNSRSLLVRLRPKVISIQEPKDLNSRRLETLASSLKSHAMGLSEEGPSIESKSIDIKSKSKSVKAIQTIKFEEDSLNDRLNDEIVEGSDENDVAFLAKQL